MSLIGLLRRLLLLWRLLGLLRLRLHHRRHHLRLAIFEHLRLLKRIDNVRIDNGDTLRPTAINVLRYEVERRGAAHLVHERLLRARRDIEQHVVESTLIRFGSLSDV